MTSSQSLCANRTSSDEREPFGDDSAVLEPGIRPAGAYLTTQTVEARSGRATTSTGMSDAARTSDDRSGALPERPACRCGAAQSTQHEDRCANGHVLKGVAGPALKVGQHSQTFWDAQDDARRELRAAIIADAGHSTDDAPRALSLAAESIAQATLVRDAAFARIIEAGGPLTSRGRTRRAFSVWLTSLDRLERNLRLVGLRRIPKPVDPLQAVRDHVERSHAEAERERQEQGR